MRRYRGSATAKVVRAMSLTLTMANAGRKPLLDWVPLTDAGSRGGVGCWSIVLSVRARSGRVQRNRRTLRVSTNFKLTARPWEATTMRTDAHHMRREERRALLEQRRTVVTRQLRRLAIELTNLNKQLEEIVRSERL